MKNSQIQKSLKKLHVNFERFLETQNDFGKDYPGVCLMIFENLDEHLFEKYCIKNIAEAIESTKYAKEKGDDYQKVKFDNQKEYAFLHFLYCAAAYFAAAIFQSNIAQKETFDFYEFEFMPAFFEFLKSQGINENRARLFMTLSHSYFEQQFELWKNEPPQIVKYGDKIFAFNYAQNEIGHTIKADLKQAMAI